MNKILYGGDNDPMNNQFHNYYDKRLQNFMAIIILGYFGIKVIFPAFFNYYPQKYYYRNIQVNTTDNSALEDNLTQNIVLNAYVPGLWNNETSDFVITVILTYVIYIFTSFSNRSYIDYNGNVSLSFLFGYIIGLSYPMFIAKYADLFTKQIRTSFFIQSIYLIILIAIIAGIVIINYQSIDKEQNNNRINYLVYFAAIMLLLFGLVLGRKKQESQSTVTYFYNNGDKCTYQQNGVLVTSGENLKLTVPFTAFILLLFFSYEPSSVTWKNAYIFVYALLLGILISSISYFGFEYFLQKQPMKQCESVNECKIKKISTSCLEPSDEEGSFNGNNGALLETEQKSKISLFNIILLVLLILVCIYLVYYYLKK